MATVDPTGKSAVGDPRAVLGRSVESRRSSQRTPDLEAAADDSTFASSANAAPTPAGSTDPTAFA